jgi:catabolite regulation protein CreA
MKRLAAALALGLLMSAPAAKAKTRIGGVDTILRILGFNDRVVVSRYDDPDVPNVSCYASLAATGGVKGSLNPGRSSSRFSIACRATGPLPGRPTCQRSSVSSRVRFRSSSRPWKSTAVALPHVILLPVASPSMLPAPKRGAREATCSVRTLTPRISRCTAFHCLSAREGTMLACVFASNILGEATSAPSIILLEAMRQPLLDPRTKRSSMSSSAAELRKAAPSIGSAPS